MSTAALKYLFLGDSIYQSFPSYQQALNQFIPSMASVDQGCYPGSTLGGAFLDLGDENYYYNGTAWVPGKRGTPWGVYDGLIFEFGRNDSDPTTSESVAAYRKGYDKLIAQGRKYLARVIPGCCPPLCISDFSAWDATDTFQTGGYYAAVQTVWSKYGAMSTDHLANFKTLVSNATYTIAGLMRDVKHPTTYPPNTTGVYEICRLLTNQINSTGLGPNNAAPEIAGKVVNFWFGQPTVGAFTLTAQSPAFPTPIARALNLTEQALQSSTINDVAKFPASTGSQVWIHYLNDATGGTATVYVDKGLAGQQSININCATSSTGLTLHSLLIADGLAAGPHMVEVDITGTGKVPLIGVTHVGA